MSLIVLDCGWIGRLVDLKVSTDASGSLGQHILLNNEDVKAVNTKLKPKNVIPHNCGTTTAEGAHEVLG